jgi:hypothetical protein
VSFFWLTYRHPDGRTAGAVVIESTGLLHARLKASLAGADRGLTFVSGHQLDPPSAELVPASMIGRLLDDGDLRKLHRMLIKKKPPAPSVRRRTTAKRRVGKIMTRGKGEITRADLRRNWPHPGDSGGASPRSSVRGLAQGEISMLAFASFVIAPVIAFAFACAVCWKWQRKMARLHEKMDRMRGMMSAGGDWLVYPRSSGNRAFDEHRAETLRLLEEKQRDFRDFVDRLRHANDKAECDQFIAQRFMAERRNRPHSLLQP